MKKMIVAVFVLTILIVAGIFLTKNITGNAISKEIENKSCLGDSCPIASGYTLQEVSQHNSKGDCWMIINNSIYNVTAFLTLGLHKPIDNLCGTDVTNIYPHDKERLSKLDYLGELK